MKIKPIDDTAIKLNQQKRQLGLDEYCALKINELIEAIDDINDKLPMLSLTDDAAHNAKEAGEYIDTCMGLKYKAKPSVSGGLDSTIAFAETLHTYCDPADMTEIKEILAALRTIKWIDADCRGIIRWGEIMEKFNSFKEGK